MSAGEGREEDRAPLAAHADGGTSSSRRWLVWSVSLVGGAILVWLASRRLDLLPDVLHVPRTDALWAAIFLQLPYAWLRAHRLAPLLEASAERAAMRAEAPGRPLARLPRRVVLGSGWLSFWIVMVLPLRLGEAARPILLGRAGTPGVTLASSTGAVALERIVDGLCIVGLLFAGLASLDAAGVGESLSPEVQALWRRSGWMGGGLFAVVLAGLFGLSRAPASVGETLQARVGRARWLQTLVRFTWSVGRSLTPVWSAGRGGLAFVALTLAYWGVTALQLWAVMVACGIEGHLGHAALVVAVVGLSLQLPGGPAQMGSFQLGMVWGVSLMGTLPGVDAGRDSFAALMYLLSLGGATALAVVGWAMLRSARRGGGGPSASTGAGADGLQDPQIP